MESRSQAFKSCDRNGIDALKSVKGKDKRDAWGLHNKAPMILRCFFVLNVDRHALIVSVQDVVTPYKTHNWCSVNRQ